MRRLYVLRPEPGASETAEKARAAGLEPVAVPLFEIEALRWQPPDPADFDALLLTSANAVRHGGEALGRYRRLPVHAVGEATATAARAAGFEVARVGDGGVEALAASLPVALRLLHLCGRDRREAASTGRQVTAVSVYRANAVERPEAIGRIAGAVAMLHSPRAAARLGDLVPDRVRGKVALAAISRAAAEAAGEDWERVAVADAPSDDRLLALAAELCEKPPQG